MYPKFTDEKDANFLQSGSGVSLLTALMSDNSNCGVCNSLLALWIKTFRHTNELSRCTMQHKNKAHLKIWV